MERGLTGIYEPSIAGGMPCQAFVPNPLPPQIEFDEVLQEKLNLAYLALGRLDASRELLPETSLILYSYIRKEAVLSSQIEGTQSTLSELLLFETHVSPGIPLDDVREVSCYVKALSFGMERINAGDPITLRLVLAMHEELMKEGRGNHKKIGEFRRIQNWIGGQSPKQAIFFPPPPNKVVQCWSDLEYFLNDQPKSMNPLLKAALAHVQFETIHPFEDGNGRLGRLLIPLILAKAKILREPLLYLSLYFKTYRDEYYSQLQQVRENGDWESWISFFAEAVIQTADQATHTTRQLLQLFREDKIRIQKLGKVTSSALRVFDVLCEKPICNPNEIAKKTNLSHATVNSVLEALTNKLDLTKEITGHKRNRVYSYNKYIELLGRGLANFEIEV
jgi:Fic family protein